MVETSVVDIVEWNSGNPNRRIIVNTGRIEDQPPLSVAESCSTLNSYDSFWGADHWTSSGSEITGAYYDLAVVKFRSTES